MNDVITLRYDLISSIKPISEALQLSAYPNPFSDAIYISLPSTANNDRLVITNSLGQVCKNIALEDETEVRINSKGMPAGVYSVSLLNNEGIVIAKTKIIAQ
jgi:flagellar hook assembly protein FlgD